MLTAKARQPPSVALGPARKLRRRNSAYAVDEFFGHDTPLIACSETSFSHVGSSQIFTSPRSGSNDSIESRDGSCHMTTMIKVPRADLCPEQKSSPAAEASGRLPQSQPPSSLPVGLQTATSVHKSAAGTGLSGQQALLPDLQGLGSITAGPCENLSLLDELLEPIPATPQQLTRSSASLSSGGSFDSGDSQSSEESNVISIDCTLWSELSKSIDLVDSFNGDDHNTERTKVPLLVDATSLGGIHVETIPPAVIKTEPVDPELTACIFSSSVGSSSGGLISQDDPIYIKSEISSSCSRGGGFPVRPTSLPLQSMHQIGLPGHLRASPQLLTPPQQSPAQQVPQQFSPTPSSMSFHSQPLTPPGSISPPNSQPCSPAGPRHTPPPPPYPGVVVSTPMSMIPVPVAQTNIQIIQPMSTTSPTSPTPRHIQPRPPTSQNVSHKIPRNTHPGCTTIKYNRKNNPELEKRRIHFCNFPSK